MVRIVTVVFERMSIIVLVSPEIALYSKDMFMKIQFPPSGHCHLTPVALV